MQTVLTIAGSDPSGGAGVQSDLRTIENLGCRGLSVITALTAQTELSVFSVNPVAADILTQQLSSAVAGHIDAVKIGMIGSSANVRAISMFFKSRAFRNVVIDPVFVSTSGVPLLETHALHLFKETLLPLANVITPNLDEAGTLTGMRVWNIGTMKEAARQIYDETMQICIKKDSTLSVLVKGGHLEGDPVDVLFNGENFMEFTSKRINGKVRHGTGCRLSSAIACSLAKGAALSDAIVIAKRFVEEYIGSTP